MIPKVRFPVCSAIKFLVTVFELIKTLSRRDGAERVLHRLADVGGRVYDAYARLFERLHLLCGRSLASGDDGSGVAHASSRRRGLSGDEGDDGLRHVLLRERRGLLLVRAAYLAYHDDAVSLGVVLKERERLQVRRADNGVAADAYRG